jgi:hypothetical protein
MALARGDLNGVRGDHRVEPPRYPSLLRAAYSAASMRRTDFNGLTDRHPLLTIESMHDKLLDGPVVSRAGIECDSRQQTRRVETFHVARVIHQVLAAKVIAALLQYMAKGIGPRIGREI